MTDRNSDRDAFQPVGEGSLVADPALEQPADGQPPRQRDASHSGGYPDGTPDTDRTCVSCGASIPAEQRQYRFCLDHELDVASEAGAEDTEQTDVDFYDCRLAAGTATMLPSRPGWHTYLYLFDGAVKFGDETVGFTENAPVTGDDVAVTATENATIVAFSLKPDAPITRQGTIGCWYIGAPTVGCFSAP